MLFLKVSGFWRYCFPGEFSEVSFFMSKKNKFEDVHIYI